MKTFFNKILFCCVAFSFIVSCKKETDTVNFDYGYNYFPDDSGRYIIYKVDSVLYNDFDINNLKRFSTQYVKEIITEQYIDNLGRTAKKIERYVTSDTSLPWQFWNVWYFVKNQTNVERVEDNYRYIKLTFPVSESNQWRGNKYNLLNQFPFVNLRYTTTNFNWLYVIKDINSTYSNGNIFSDSTLTVLQVADSSNVQKVYSVEKYAKNIGLIYKEFWRLDAQIDPDAIPQETYENNAEFGFIVRQSAIQSGTE